MVCAECMEMCCLGGKNSVVKGLKGHTNSLNTGHIELIMANNILYTNQTDIFMQVCTLWAGRRGGWPPHKSRISFLSCDKWTVIKSYCK